MLYQLLEKGANLPELSMVHVLERAETRRQYEAVDCVLLWLFF